jgi:hypothetical protein
MKSVICFITLVGITFVIATISGCGKGGDEPKKVVSESTANQTVVEQKPDLPEKKDTTATQKAESANVTKNQPAAQETKKDLPSDSKAAVPHKTEPVKATEAQPAVQDVPDVIVIENKVYTADKKGPVTFHHAKHNKEYKVSCTECHHLYKDGKNMWKEGDHVEKCVVCHDPAEDKGKTIKLQNAFHQNCKDCHKEVNKEGKKAPYTKCAGCHIEPGTTPLK